MNEYFLHVDGKWEEVDKYIFDNYKYVEKSSENGFQPRYSNNRFSIIDNQVNLAMTSISKQDIGIIARIVGCQFPANISTPGGFAPKPKELLLIRKGNSTSYYEVATGNRFKKVA